MKEIRRVVKINKTIYVSLPTVWLRANDVKQGSELELNVNLKSIIIRKKLNRL